MKIKEYMSFQETLDYLEEIGERRSIRTLRRWLRNCPSVRDAWPKLYSTRMLAIVFATHGILKLKQDLDSEEDPYLKDEVEKYIREKFPQTEADLMFKFILNKLGYRFNKKRLIADLTNEYALLPDNKPNYLKPSELHAAKQSCERLRKLTTEYYFRKIRSDKKSK